MKPHADDRLAHDARRIEAFSDIVIGFCLAEIGLGLAFPRFDNDLNAVWSNVVIFLAAFFAIVALWWLHHRVFSTYFVASTPMIVLNFALLAAIVLTSYFLQVFVHARVADQVGLAYFQLVTYGFSNVYALVGALLLTGLIVKRRELDTGDLRWGYARFAHIVIVTAFFIVLGATSTAVSHAVEVSRTALFVMVALMFAGRYLGPVLAKRLIPDRAGVTGNP